MTRCGICKNSCPISRTDHVKIWGCYSAIDRFNLLSVDIGFTVSRYHVPSVERVSSTKAFVLGGPGDLVSGL